jgi:catechol 2,3-dioxygenase-like lactoylglutathione lyase family enzyme
MKLSVEIYTRKVIESSDFYTNHFNFRVKTEMDGFVVLQHNENPAYEIMFCVPDSPFVNEIFRPEYSGQGIIFQAEVGNIMAEFERMKQSGVPVVLDPVTEPVNGTHFTVEDPNGILIDIVQYE